MKDREALAAQALPWARGSATAACRRWPWLRHRLGWEELVGRGMLAVAAAVAAYDPARGGWRNLARASIRLALLKAYQAEACPSRPGVRERCQLGEADRAASLAAPGAAAEARDELAWLLARLPPRERDVVLWRGRDGLPLAEVGRRLGVGASRAHALHETALRKLRRAGP